MWKHSDKASHQFKPIFLFPWVVNTGTIANTTCLIWIIVGRGNVNHTYSALQLLSTCRNAQLPSSGLCPPFGNSSLKNSLNSWHTHPWAALLQSWSLDVFPWIWVVCPTKFCVWLVFSLLSRMICSFVKTQHNTWNRLNMLSVSCYQPFFQYCKTDMQYNLFLGDTNNKCHSWVCCC